METSAFHIYVINLWALIQRKCNTEIILYMCIRRDKSEKNEKSANRA